MSAPGEPGFDRDEAYRRMALWAAQGIAAEAGGVIAEGSVVIDEFTGRVGRVASLYGDDCAQVAFQGGGDWELLPKNGLSLAADQDWEPEGGWDE